MAQSWTIPLPPCWPYSRENRRSEFRIFSLFMARVQNISLPWSVQNKLVMNNPTQAMQAILKGKQGGQNFFLIMVRVQNISLPWSEIYNPTLAILPHSERNRMSEFSIIASIFL